MSRSRLSRPTALGCETLGTRVSSSSKSMRPSRFSRRASVSTGALSVSAPETLPFGISSARTQTTTGSSKPSDPSRSHALCGFSVRRRPRACHGACARLRPGRLRASHAVCLRCSTLEPVICARKEETENESLSTIERIRIELFAMRPLNPSFKTDSLCSSSASSTDFSDSLPHPLRNEKTPNNGAAENCSGRQRVSRWLLPAEPAAQPARHAPPPSAVSELESLGVLARVP